MKMCIKFLVILLLIITYQGSSYCSDDHNVHTKLLETMKSYMDLEVDPCENFYQYACGNWENNQEWENSEEELQYVDTIGGLEYQANKQLAEILEQRIVSKKYESNEVYRKVRIYYESCKEAELEVDNGVDRYLESIKPGEQLEWPTKMTTEAQVSNFKWLQVLGHLRAIGLNDVLIQEQLMNRNATSYILQLDKPDRVDFDEAAQTEMLELSNSASQRMLMDQLKQLRYKLKQLIISSSGAAQTVNELTLAELTRRLPGTDYSVYFEALLGEKVTPETPILVRNLAYFRRLNDLLNKTKPLTLLYYIKLKLKDYLATVRPTSKAPHHCIQNLRAHMSLALDYINEREQYQYVRNATDAVIHRVFHLMQAKFEDLIETHAGEDFTEEELAFLRLKIREMQLNIGNLPEHVQQRYFTDYYATLSFKPHDFHANHLSLLQHANARENYLLKLTPSSTPAPEHTFFKWKHGSPAYNQPTNRLLIPYAYLQWPIFHKDFHELLLFAELGNTLGHEIMHGFDTVGLQYDAFGNPSMLFRGAMRAKPHLQRSLTCLQREPTSNINEKLADFNGFRLAYESYFHRPIVPKFRSASSTWSNKQLFFIKFAQFFCAVNPQRIAYDGSHDTPFKRVPQVVANNPEFAQEFGCTTNVKMIAKQQCDMW